MEVVQLENISVIYGTGSTQVVALNHVSLSVEKGRVVCIYGKSGSGKSTLLNVVGGLERPSEGRVRLLENDFNGMSKKASSDFRLNQIGYVYQGCYLISNLNVEDNILLPNVTAGRPVDRDYYHHLLDKLDITGKAKSMPNQLSGGEKQRVAIARALINRPALILADEPTGNLDSVNGDQVFDLLLTCVKDLGSTLLYVTHDLDKLELADRKIEMKDGVLYE